MPTGATVDHIARPSLPWRAESRTECGREAGDVASLISRDAAVRKVKDQGQQRAAMSTCMTCWSTADRYADWATSPGDVMAREVPLGYRWRRSQGEPLIDRELRAVAALVAAHRDEFDGYLAGLESAPTLTAARQRRAHSRRAAR